MVKKNVCMVCGDSDVSFIDVLAMGEPAERRKLCLCFKHFGAVTMLTQVVAPGSIEELLDMAKQMPSEMGEYFDGGRP